jgi:uncharacterized protein
MYSKFLMIFALFLTGTLAAQPLKRLASKGVALEPVTEAKKNELGLKDTKGLCVLKVIPGSTAEALKVQQNDVILKINGTDLKTIDDVFRPELVLHEGDDVTYTIVRAGKEKVLKGKAVGNPRENPGNLSLEYSSFAFRDGRISSMFLQQPTTGKKPGILFVPGLYCGSVDNQWEHHVYRKIVYQLAEKGYIVMRAEKPGLGDSENTPDCESIDFPTEVESFRAALDAFKQHPDVDTNNIFLFGHSMGAMEAPFIADGKNVRGIVAMGLTVKPWLEYLTEMVRVQNPQLGIDYLQNEKDLKLYETLLYELLVEKKSPAEMAKNPEYDRIMRRDMSYEGGDGFLTRDITFSQTLNDQDIAAAWAKIDCKVLSAHGETDIQVLNDFSHRELVKLINTYHPGNATFLELVDTDHNLLVMPTMEESYQHNADGSIGSLFPTRFNTKIADEFDRWIRSVIVPQP